MNALVIIGFFLTSLIYAAEDSYVAKSFKSSNGESLNYRIYLPKGIDSEDKKYPLVLLLHGAGERGNDNEKQLKNGAKELLNYSLESRDDAIIIAPQCPKDKQWVNTPWSELSHKMPSKPSQPMQLAIELLNDTIKNLPVDPRRIYVTGISMGGFGTWDIIQRHPQLFAAAIPICGGGDIAFADKLTDMPIWVFHGGADTVVKTSRSRDMVAAIKEAGGSPLYKEYKGVTHNSWTRTYKNKTVLKWLFEQKLTTTNGDRKH